MCELFQILKTRGINSAAFRRKARFLLLTLLFLVSHYWLMVRKSSSVLSGGSIVSFGISFASKKEGSAFFHLQSSVRGDMIDLFITTTCFCEVEDFSCFCQRHLFHYPFKCNYGRNTGFFCFKVTSKSSLLLISPSNEKVIVSCLSHLAIDIGGTALGGPI